MEEFPKNFLKNILIFGGITALITFVIVLLQTTVFTKLVYYIAVTPRTAYGILGIFLSCWGHWSWGHWSNNMLGWLGLCPAMLTFGVWPFLFLFGFVQIFSGCFVWLISSQGAHAGLSGILCGFFGFFVVSIFLEQPLRMKTLLVVLVTAILYFSTMFLTLFNFKKGVSWQSHIFGFLGGIIFSILFFTKFNDCLSNPLHWKRKKNAAPAIFPGYIDSSSMHVDSFEVPPLESYNIQGDNIDKPYGKSNLVVYGKPCS